MCGFAGFTNFIKDDGTVLEKMMNRIVHRGPDSQGKFVDGDIKFNELWRFFVASNEEINGQIRVSGEFKQINKISAELKQIMRDNGVENAVIEQF